MNAERRKHVEERINALRVEISKLELELEQLSDTEQERSIPENLPLRIWQTDDITWLWAAR